MRNLVYIEVESDATLHKRENLINEVIKLEKEKDVRMEPIRALFHGRDQLCEELKVPCSSLNQDHILTSVQLKNLQNLVSGLKKSMVKK